METQTEIQIIQTATPPAKKVLSTPGLASLIRSMASNERELCAADVCAKIPAIARDMKLSGAWDLNIKKNPDIGAVDMVRSLCFFGTQAQRARITALMEPKHALAFDAIVNEVAGSSEMFKAMIEFLKSQLQSLADFYGCQVAGNIGDMADTIFETHCDLSVLDFVLFFQHVKQGRYSLEFQHVAVRGINMQFFNEWMTGYLEERSEARATVHQELKKRHLDKTVDVSISEQYIEMVKRKEEHSNALKELRGIWTKETANDWKAKLQALCAWAFPDDPRRAWVEIKNYLDQKTGSVENASEYYLPTLVPILHGIATASRKFGAHGLLLRALIDTKRQYQTPENLWQSLFDIPPPDGIHEKTYEQACSWIAITAFYRIEKSWPVYREEMIKTPNAIPINQDEFFHKQSVEWLKGLGVKNPFWAVLDVIV